jgi:hypothetical protein
MIPDAYVWLTWSSASLVPWLVLFKTLRRWRKVMSLVSLFTMPFGLTEPLFVPGYWNPPSLFHLAQLTGFDIESLIFCFGMSGVCAVLYNIITARTLRSLGMQERHAGRHRYHRFALLVPVAAFPLLWTLPWNPIYSAIVALGLGGAATIACRHDLAWTTVAGGLLFLGYYAAFMFLLEWSAPGYIGRVWNLSALSGFVIGGVPLEEFLFGFAFGTYWSGIYEHLTWQRPVAGHGHAAASEVKRA